MVDQAKENLNIETGALWALKNVKKFEIGKSKLSDEEIKEATIKEDELTKLETNFETKTTTEWDETKKTVLQKSIWTLPPDIKTAINGLNRPVAQQWLADGYTTIQGNINTMNQSVQNSKMPRRIKSAANRLFKK